MKSSFLLVLLFLHSVSLRAQWSQEYTYVNGVIAASLNHSNLNAQRDDFSELGLEFDKLWLLDGSGIRVNSFVSNEFTKTAQENRNDMKYKLGIDTKLFLSHNSDLEVGLLKTSQFNSSASRLTDIFRNLDQPHYETKSNATLNYLLGNDEDFFKFEFTFANEDLERRFTDDSVRKDFINQDLAEVLALWRQSEDTYWGGQYAEVNVESGQNLQDIEQTIRHVYLAMVTNIFGNSALAINIGQSQLKGINKFSWQIVNTTQLNDYSTINFSSYRQFEQDYDVNSEASLNTKHSLHYQAQITSYLQTIASYSIEKREQSQLTRYKYQQLSLGLNALYSEDWLVTCGYNLQQLDDNFGEQQYTQNEVNVAVKRRFL